MHHRSAALYWKPLITAFEEAADPLVAVGQQAYMKGHFRFHGIKTPRRRELLQAFLRSSGMPSSALLDDAVRYAWECDHREMHYSAVEVLTRAVRKGGPEYLPLAEDLVLTNSWWDTVDPIAVHVVGAILSRHREEVPAWNTRWMNSGELWCQRVALIFQLQWKGHTDQDLLFANCERLAGHKEFFIRKGIGWALRQYARTDPAAVKVFVENHTLSALSAREALKHFSDRSSRAMAHHPSRSCGTPPVD